MMCVFVGWEPLRNLAGDAPGVFVKVQVKITDGRFSMNRIGRLVDAGDGPFKTSVGHAGKIAGGGNFVAHAKSAAGGEG